MGAERFSIDVRWTGIMQSLLGDAYEVIEEGFGGRSTAFDDPRPEMPLRNGQLVLPMILEAHSPLDLVILMLGTTDTKEIMQLTPAEIARGMESLVHIVHTFKAINACAIKKILVAAPVVVKEDAEFASRLFKGGRKKGLAITALYREIAAREDCAFIDVNEFVVVDEEEGVHLPHEAHRTLARCMSTTVRDIFNA